MAKLHHSKTFWQAYQRCMPLLFLIYISAILEGRTSICKIFADDTSLFSKVNDKSNRNTQLDSDLEIISKWAFQWKMLFKPDTNKQPIEVCFSYRREKKNLSTIYI